MRNARHAGTAIALSLATVAAAQPDRMVASEKGSLLVYSSVEIRWDAGGNVVQDTLLTLVNDWTSDTDVKVTFINGDPPLLEPSGQDHPGWNAFSFTTNLTANQPSYWSALSGQPGPTAGAMPPFTVLDSGGPLPGRPAPDGTTDRVLRGFVYAWAVDAQGREVSWNHLTGGATLYDYRDHTAWEHRAWTAQSATGAAAGNLLLAPFGRLDLDNQEYVAPPTTLVFDFFASDGTALAVAGGTPFVTDTDLTLLPAGADLRSGGTPISTSADVEIWNEDEIRFFGLARCFTCWDQTLLSQYTDGFNHFLVTVLQSDMGYARIEGTGNTFCANINDCCVVGIDPGCDDPVCEAAVCEIDSFCCDVQWDPTCVSEAGVFCSVCPETAALLGVQSRRLVAPGARVMTGVNLTGIGNEPATIFSDVTPATTAHAGATSSSRPLAAGAPTQDRISGEELGSVLVYPRIELRWDANGTLIRDTIIAIQNEFIGTVEINVAYVNGDPTLFGSGTPGEPDFERNHDGWTRVVARRRMTPNQSSYWSLASGLPGPHFNEALPPFTMLDPDLSGTAPGRPDPAGSGDRVLRGYAYVWAVNSAGAEISHNHLSGTATIVDDREPFAITVAAYAAQAVGTTTEGTVTGTPGILNLDGVEFASPFSLVLLDFYAAEGITFTGGTGPWASTSQNDAELTLHPIDATLGFSFEVPGTRASLLIWNEDETQFSGLARCVSCWDQTLLSLYAGGGSPNHFLVGNLQTNKGKARIDGVASAACPDSQARALVGVLTHRFTQAQGSGRAASASLLAGAGTEPAIITFPPDGAAIEACCLATGACVMLTEGQCSTQGGQRQGPGSTCAGADCPSCGDPVAGACNVVGLTPFCNDAECCVAVCAADPFCCEASWDSACVRQAGFFCTHLCPGDTNDDGVIDVDDLVNIILLWGTDGIGENPPGTPVHADVAGSLPGDPPDGVVNVNDLNLVIVSWGACP